MPPPSAGKVASPYKQTALFCEVLYHELGSHRWTYCLNKGVNRRTGDRKNACMHFGGKSLGVKWLLLNRNRGTFKDIKTEIV